jgi:hypothetical protein
VRRCCTIGDRLQVTEITATVTLLDFNEYSIESFQIKPQGSASENGWDVIKVLTAFLFLV